MKISPSKVRKAREQAMLSQDEVAKMVGASDFSVWRWEHGEEPVGIRPKAARKLHEALGLRLGDLTPAEEGTAGPKGQLPTLPPPTLQLEDMYVAKEAERRSTLEAASAEERDGYAATIDRVIRDVTRGIPEWEDIADDGSKPEGERKVARETLERLWLHIDRLRELRTEATGGAEEPPQEELRKFIETHAGVGAA